MKLLQDEGAVRGGGRGLAGGVAAERALPGAEEVGGQRELLQGDAGGVAIDQGAVVVVDVVVVVEVEVMVGAVKEVVGV